MSSLHVGSTHICGTVDGRSGTLIQTAAVHTFPTKVCYPSGVTRRHHPLFSRVAVTHDSHLQCCPSPSTRSPVR